MWVVVAAVAVVMFALIEDIDAGGTEMRLADRR